jgi:cytochrome c peroxidase
MASGHRLALAACALVVVALGSASPAAAKNGGGLRPLSSEPVPVPPDVQRFIRDTNAAAKLGKALFWDMQAGSDGRTACASCHYDAGADSRSRNQVNPHGSAGFFANTQLGTGDFPLVGERVVGSQGVLPSAFDGIADGDPFDMQTFAGADAIFSVGGANVRRVTGRNAPSTVNAVFNFRQFWDGRAENDFNGVTPFGARDSDARVGRANVSGGVDKVAISIASSSLASQAVGPPGNAVEMSADGRTLSDIGRKLLALRPLGTQEVSRSDSLLGAMAAPSGRGLGVSYSELIRQAFQPEWWDADARMSASNGRGYSLMQFNFPLFWGLAIQAYESRLISDQTPVDRWLAGEPDALSTDALRGMSVFMGKGECMECHTGAALTDATAPGAGEHGGTAGFHNNGVRTAASDPGLVDAAFKTPGLRNVELTAPFFHDGGQGTLRQLVDFYDRGGNVPGELKTLGLSESEKDALVAFLRSLTDPRVRDQAAPFDHPQLLVPAGAQTRADSSIVTDASGRAVDCFKEVPATGAVGGQPLPRFPEFTGPPCYAPPPAGEPAPADPAVEAVAISVPNAAPAAKSCSSRRNFSIRLHRPRRDRVRSVRVFVNGRKVAEVRTPLGSRRAPVDLRGLPRGLVDVKVVARTARGRELLTLRRYRTCSARRG